MAATTAVAIPTVAAASSSTVLSSGKVSRGNVVVNSSGLTLYGYTKDTKNSSACNGSCTSVWVPVLTHGSTVVKSGSGLKQSLVGKFKRSNGAFQVTYNGHPLYHYRGDSKAGQQNGENKSLAGGHWYVVGVGGKLLKPSNGLIGGY
jgi:predicted lipoprotein with Yx(FWY)xxD motif